jgi:hypothetical protein
VQEGDLIGLMDKIREDLNQKETRFKIEGCGVP